MVQGHLQGQAWLLCYVRNSKNATDHCVLAGCRGGASRLTETQPCPLGETQLSHTATCKSRAWETSKLSSTQKQHLLKWERCFLLRGDQILALDGGVNLGGWKGGRCISFVEHSSVRDICPCGSHDPVLIFSRLKDSCYLVRKKYYKGITFQKREYYGPQRHKMNMY